MVSNQTYLTGDQKDHFCQGADIPLVLTQMENVDHLVLRVVLSNDTCACELTLPKVTLSQSRRRKLALEVADVTTTSIMARLGNMATESGDMYVEVQNQRTLKTLVLPVTNPAMKLDDLSPGTMYRLKLDDDVVYVKTLGTPVQPPKNVSVSEIDGELEIGWDPPDDVTHIESYLIKHNGHVIGEVKDPHANCTLIAKVTGRLALQSKAIGGGLSAENALLIASPPSSATYRALFDYDPVTMSPNKFALRDELRFKQHELLQIHTQVDADGFFRGTNDNNETGLIPSNFVQLVE